MTLFKKAALVAALITTTATSAFALGTADMNRLIAMGYDAETVSMLTDAELAKIERALHNGDDSDARMHVNSIILNFMMKQMMHDG